MIICIFINSCMQGVYTYIPETNNISRVYSVACVLYVQLVLRLMLLFFTVTLACVQCPVWLFYVVP